MHKKSRPDLRSGDLKPNENNLPFLPYALAHSQRQYLNGGGPFWSHIFFKKT
jgi:hypothetical protein